MIALPVADRIVVRRECHMFDEISCTVRACPTRVRADDIGNRAWCDVVIETIAFVGYRKKVASVRREYSRDAGQMVDEIRLMIDHVAACHRIERFVHHAQIAVGRNVVDGRTRSDIQAMQLGFLAKGSVGSTSKYFTRGARIRGVGEWADFEDGRSITHQHCETCPVEYGGRQPVFGQTVGAVMRLGGRIGKATQIRIAIAIDAQIELWRLPEAAVFRWCTILTTSLAPCIVFASIRVCAEPQFAQNAAII